MANKIKFHTILRDIGSHFTINKMLTFDSVKLRLEREQSLSYMSLIICSYRHMIFINYLKKIVFYKSVDQINGEIL